MNNQSQPAGEKEILTAAINRYPIDETYLKEGIEKQKLQRAAFFEGVRWLMNNSPSTPNQSDELQEARKEIEELKEEIRKLRCWLKYNDWLKQNYKLDDWSTNPGPHYFQKRDGKVIPFNISKPEMDIRREYIKLNNL